MYSSQLQLKFSNVSEAKIAAQSLCELLKSRISVFDFHGLHVTVGKDGDLSISVRFRKGYSKGYRRYKTSFFIQIYKIYRRLRIFF